MKMSAETHWNTKSTSQETIICTDPGRTLPAPAVVQKHISSQTSSVTKTEILMQNLRNSVVFDGSGSTHKLETFWADGTAVFVFLRVSTGIKLKIVQIHGNLWNISELSRLHRCRVHARFKSRFKATTQGDQKLPIYMITFMLHK